MKKNKGFTLIEMLVVIAIIGILAAVVLTALGPSRNKAKDARVISDLEQVRALAEANYSSTGTGYGGYFTAGQVPITGSPAALTALAADVVANGTTPALTVSLSSNGASYAAYAGISTGVYCVDSSGNSKSLTAAPSGQVCQ